MRRLRSAGRAFSTWFARHDHRGDLPGFFQRRVHSLPLVAPQHSVAGRVVRLDKQLAYRLHVPHPVAPSLLPCGHVRVDQAQHSVIVSALVGVFEAPMLLLVRPDRAEHRLPPVGPRSRLAVNSWQVWRVEGHAALGQPALQVLDLRVLRAAGHLLVGGLEGGGQTGEKVRGARGADGGAPLGIAGRLLPGAQCGPPGRCRGVRTGIRKVKGAHACACLQCQEV